MSIQELRSAVAAAVKSRLLTPKQAGEMIGRAPSSMKRWRSNGTGPKFVRINGYIFYEASAIEAWLDEHRHGSTAEYDSHQGANGFGRAAAV